MTRIACSRFFAPRAARHALFLLVVLLLAALAGCGRKGPVRPKLTALPAAPPAIELHQQGESFLLSWEIPSKNQDGNAAEDLNGFRILRLAYAGAEACPTCRDPQQEVARVSLRYPEPAQRLGQRLYWRDAEVAAGSGYRYAVVPVTLGGQDGAAALVHRTWQAPPATPQGLQADAVDGKVELSWQAVTPPAGSELLGYNLYRRLEGALFAPLPINPQPLAQTRLADRNLEPGRRYEYRVAAVVRSGAQQLESAPSAGAWAQP